MSDLSCEDWRQTPPEAVARLLQQERQRWIDHLHWDTEASLGLLERSRQDGQAAGLIAHDDEGRLAGWTYYLLNNRRLQIGALVAASGEATRQLLDEVLRTPEADLASDVLCFAFPASPAFEGALARRRFEVTRYLYLQRALAPATAASPAGSPLSAQLRPWTEDDGVGTVRLLARWNWWMPNRLERWLSARLPRGEGA